MIVAICICAMSHRAARSCSRCHELGAAPPWAALLSPPRRLEVADTGYSAVAKPSGRNPSIPASVGRWKKSLSMRTTSATADHAMAVIVIAGPGDGFGLGLSDACPRAPTTSRGPRREGNGELIGHEPCLHTTGLTLRIPRSPS